MHNPNMNLALKSTRSPIAVAIRNIRAAGRYLFLSSELAALTGREPGGAAIRSALKRCAASGLITQVSAHPAAWLILPTKHARVGAAPVDWWLGEYLHQREPNYYLALLSAARQWGSGDDVG
jgi:hypothetical protein